MESPFLLPGVDIRKMQQFRKQLEAVLDKAFRGLSDMALHFFRDLVEMVELVPDHANEVSHGLEIVLPVIADLLYLNRG